MKISIITVHLNHLAGLRRTAESILSQSCLDYEWIVVDGGSSDGSPEWIAQWASNPEYRITWWCSEPDSGIYAAMNKGIAQARGEYLHFLNAGDCYREEQALKTFLGQMSGEADVWYGEGCYQTAAGLDVRPKPHTLTLSFLWQHALCHQSMLIRRTLLDERPYDERYRIASDWKATLQWLLEGRCFRYVDVCLSLCEPSGVSGDLCALNAERNAIADEVIPEALQVDLRELLAWREREAYHPELPQVYAFLTRRRLYKRLLHASLRFISLLDSLLSR